MGGQYKGGRVKGRKNLTRTSSGLIKNQHGVTFTESEKKLLESRVNAVNRKHNKMKRAEATLPRKYAGREMGDTVGSLQLMGKESDFIIAKRTKSLQRFRSREQFENYLDSLKTANSPDYIRDRIRGYKANHMQSLRDAYGDDAKDIIMKIRMMKPDEYMKLVQQDETMEIGFNYPPDQSKLNAMRSALGMKLKDDDFYMEEYDE